jgi:isoquinoline 1-oxidoreductase beta subunit
VNDLANPSRRAFLQVSAVGAGLVIGFQFAPRAARAAMLAQGPVESAAFAPNAFLRIDPDNTVVVIVKHLEMGQGVYTGLPTLVAEELDADWGQVHVESAPADVKRYANLAWGGSAQGTGGSTSMRGSWDQLRHAGATARALLIAAAAQRWNADAKGLRAERGYVIDARSNRRASFGELAALAATLPIPQDVPLKVPREWRLIGKHVPRTDTAAKVNGTAVYTIDHHLPNALTAVVARPPVFGAKLKRYDASKALAMKGVKAVVEIAQGVAVVATDFWHAWRAREALIIEWDRSGGFTASSDAIREQYRALLRQPGAVASSRGEVDAALNGAAKRIEAEFEFPYLAHAAMEPLNCVVRLDDKSCEVWAGSQSQTLDQAKAAATAGLKPEQVTIHTLLAGGSFGRHANPISDYICEAVAVAKATRSLNAPIRLCWAREDDMRGGYYRPAYVHAIAAGVDEQGRPVGWSHRGPVDCGRHAVCRHDEGWHRSNVGRGCIELALCDSEPARRLAYHIAWCASAVVAQCRQHTHRILDRSHDRPSCTRCREGCGSLPTGITEGTSTPRACAEASSPEGRVGQVTAEGSCARCGGA